MGFWFVVPSRNARSAFNDLAAAFVVPPSAAASRRSISTN
jgi:hypothetical protein